MFVVALEGPRCVSPSLCHFIFCVFCLSVWIPKIWKAWKSKKHRKRFRSFPSVFARLHFLKCMQNVFARVARFHCRAFSLFCCSLSVVFARFTHIFKTFFCLFLLVFSLFQKCVVRRCKSSYDVSLTSFGVIRCLANIVRSHTMSSIICFFIISCCFPRGRALRSHL